MLREGKGTADVTELQDSRLARPTGRPKGSGAQAGSRWSACQPPGGIASEEQEGREGDFEDGWEAETSWHIP